MNISSKIRALNTNDRRRERGMVTALFIALLAIMMVLIMVESSAVIRLHREVKMLEQQQLKRLNAQPTNSVHLATQP
jgi:hypothetical protein